MKYGYIQGEDKLFYLLNLMVCRRIGKVSK